MDGNYILFGNQAAYLREAGLLSGKFQDGLAQLRSISLVLVRLPHQIAQLQDGLPVKSRVFNTCKWNNMAETAELRLFLCQVYKNLMLYGVVFHVKQWYNGGYETLV